MELHFLTVFLVFGFVFAVLRIVVYFLFREAERPNVFVWFILAGLIGAVSRNWWASEIFIADSLLYDADDHQKYFIGNYNGQELKLFHHYVDNSMSDTLIAFSTKYWENDDSLEYVIIPAHSFSEIGGSIDYYNVPPPTSIKGRDIPFWNPHVKKWSLCDIDTFWEWLDNPEKYKWSQ